MPVKNRPNPTYLKEWHDGWIKTVKSWYNSNVPDNEQIEDIKDMKAFKVVVVCVTLFVSHVFLTYLSLLGGSLADESSCADRPVNEQVYLYEMKNVKQRKLQNLLTNLLKNKMATFFLFLQFLFFVVVYSTPTCNSDPEDCSNRYAHIKFHASIVSGYCINHMKGNSGGNSHWELRLQTYFDSVSNSAISKPMSFSSLSLPDSAIPIHGRRGHSSVLFDGRYLIIHGGQKGKIDKIARKKGLRNLIDGDMVNHTSLVDIDALSFRRLPLAVPLVERAFHSAITNGYDMVIYGGIGTGRTLLGDVFSISFDKTNENVYPVTMLWKSTIESLRAKHTAVLYSSSHSSLSASQWMVVCGGITYKGNDKQEIILGDVTSFDFATNKWIKLFDNEQTPDRIYTPRYGHQAAIFGQAMYVFGGRNQHGKELGDLLAFDLVLKTWRLLSSNPAIARTDHSMVYLQACRSLVIFGGRRNDNAFSDVLTFDLDSDESDFYTLPAVASHSLTRSGLLQHKESINDASSPPSHSSIARYGHTAHACGSRMFVFGGRVADNGEDELWEWY